MRRILVLCVFLLMAACAPSPAATATPIPSATTAPKPAAATPAPATATVAPAPAVTAQSTPGSGVLFTIVKQDGSKVNFSLDQFQKLPSASLTVSSKVNEGPKLKDVLAAVGVTSFQSVDIAGSNGKTNLPIDEVDDNTLLVVSNRNTIKLATTYMNRQFWINDISLISVK